MVKYHTRSKRRKGIRSTTRKHRFWFTHTERKKGPKSFTSLEKAEAWAKDNIDQKKYRLHVTPTGKLQWRPN